MEQGNAGLVFPFRETDLLNCIHASMHQTPLPRWKTTARRPADSVPEAVATGGGGGGGGGEGKHGRVQQVHD